LSALLHVSNMLSRSSGWNHYWRAEPEAHTHLQLSYNLG
jgi:hypothetical protein